jgi:hypothetical protein
MDIENFTVAMAVNLITRHAAYLSFRIICFISIIRLRKSYLHSIPILSHAGVPLQYTLHKSGGALRNAMHKSRARHSGIHFTSRGRAAPACTAAAYPVCARVVHERPKSGFGTE